MKKKLALLAALAMTMSMFTACGDNKDDSSSAAPTEDNSSVVEDTSSEEESSEEVSSEEESSEEESSEAEPVEFDGTLYTEGEYGDDWGAPNFVIDSDGNVMSYIDYTYFEDYRDTGCTITYTYEFEKTMDMKTLEEAYYPYYLLGPCFASDWSKIYATGTEEEPFITGVPEELDARVAKQGDEREDFEGEYFMQSDGYIVYSSNCQNEDATEWSSSGETTFNLTPAAVAYMLDNLAVGDDGESVWGGMLFQTYGINILSVTISELAE